MEDDCHGKSQRDTETQRSLVLGAEKVQLKIEVDTHSTVPTKAARFDVYICMYMYSICTCIYVHVYTYM